MEVFFEFLYADPYLSLGYLFAAFGALALLLLVRGFFSSLRYIFTMDGHEEHMEHWRFDAIWGVLLLFALFTVWQGVRIIAGFFTGDAGPSGSTLITLAVVWTLYFVLYQFAIKHTK